MAETKKAASLRKIEELKQELGIPDVVLEGMKAANGWKSGRQVGEQEFKKACEDFLSAPVDGRAADKEAKG